MHLEVRRAGSGEPVLVFVHGWGFNGAVWESTVSRLKDHYRCLVVDLPGFGASSPPEGEYSLAALSATLTRELPQDAVWVGWSLGGMVALQAARDQPCSVRSLLLVATTPRFVQSSGWPHAVSEDLLESFGRDLRGRYHQTLARFIALQARGSRDARETIRLLRDRFQRAPRPRPEILAAGLRILREADLRPWIGGLQQPANLVLGERDRLVPVEVSEDLHRLCPAWRVNVLPGLGHAPFLSNPDDFCRALTAFVHAAH